MKKQLVLLLAMLTVLVFAFTGCKNQNNNSGVAASSGMNLTSAVSGVESGLVSGGNELASQVSGVVSGAGSAIASAVSGVGSAVASTVSG